MKTSKVLRSRAARLGVAVAVVGAVLAGTGSTASAFFFDFPWQKKTISGSVWHDSNGNGIKDIGELAVAGVKMKVAAVAGFGQVIHVVTNAKGEWHAQVSSLVSKVCVEADASTFPSGYAATVPNAGGFHLSSHFIPAKLAPWVCKSTTGSKLDLILGLVGKHFNFGFNKPLPLPVPPHPAPVPPKPSPEPKPDPIPGGYAKIGDRAFYDTNRNGVQDADEHGIAGVTIEILSGGKVQSTKHTVAKGWYGAEVPAGTYTLRILLPYGCSTLTTPDVTKAFTVTAGQHLTNKDIGCV